MNDYIEIMEREENLKRLTEIGKANDLVIEMQHEVDKYTKLLQLAKEDQVYTVTHNVNYFNFIFRIKPAYNYFYAPKDTDKRSKEYKANKLTFESLEKYLEDEVFKRPVKIVDMSRGGYDNTFACISQLPCPCEYERGLAACSYDADHSMLRQADLQRFRDSILFASEIP
jgi:hypothetical protein